VETARAWGRVHGRLAYECEGCDVVFFPRPIETSADYEQYYPYLKDFDGARFEWELRIRVRKYRHQLGAIRRYRPDARKLTDVGAGPGYLCKVAMDAGWKALGIEASSPAVEAGRREFGVRYVELDNVEPGSQDAITCHHVLEHLEEPASFLETLRSKLVSGGILVVHVSNREPLTYLARNVLRRTRERDADLYCQLYYPEHITGFTRRSLAAALQHVGFEPLRVSCVSMWSRFYDPFFLGNYFRDGAGRRIAKVEYGRLVRQVVQSVGENVGNLFGRGDWVVGHFRLR